MYKTILFDLDGTLTDPKEGITKSFQFALRKMGIAADDLEPLTAYIGPPLHDTFRIAYGMDEVGVQAAVTAFRAYFGTSGLYENKLYPGIAELLAALKDKGYGVLLATSKAEVYAAQILEHFNIARYFDVIAGSELDGSRIKKAEVIAHALAQYGTFEKRGCVMIGDREHDIIGARANQIASIGVLYGYGTRDELTHAGADIITESVNTLGTLLGV